MEKKKHEGWLKIGKNHEGWLKIGKDHEGWLNIGKDHEGWLKIGKKHGDSYNLQPSLSSFPIVFNGCHFVFILQVSSPPDPARQASVRGAMCLLNPKCR